MEININNKRKIMTFAKENEQKAIFPETNQL